MLGILLEVTEPVEARYFGFSRLGFDDGILVYDLSTTMQYSQIIRQGNVENHCTSNNLL